MNRTEKITALALVALLPAMVITLWLFMPQLQSAATWQRMAAPGPLSIAHQPLENNCAACHAPIKGVEDAGCVACHAATPVLLQRKPTAFHADIADTKNCVACHKEHDGGRSLRVMDHAALTDIVLDRLEHAPEGNEGAVLLQHLKAHRPETLSGGVLLATGASYAETLLDCASCHSPSYPHDQLFGTDCAACHGTTAWSIAEFRHPRPSSNECAECHLAPLSHYKPHFRMMSQPIAKQRNAKPEQCNLCHQTTNWNDIRQVGFYDHH
tara:strand:- start:5262 stop:6065 length:804 start_codon:yes stop_codon:yes gene_type:complete